MVPCKGLFEDGNPAKSQSSVARRPSFLLSQSHLVFSFHLVHVQTSCGIQLRQRTSAGGCRLANGHPLTAMATSSRKLGKQPLGDTRASPVPAVLDRVNEEPSQDEAEASTRKPRASTATPDADSSASRTSTSSRSAKDNDGSPSSSQASTLGKLRAGEDAAQLSVSSLLSQATAGTDRYALAGPSTATPVLDGIRALIHDLTTIEFNFGGLPIRLRLGLLWFVLILVGGILLIRSQVLHPGERQSPVEQPQNGTPVIVSHGGSGSVNGTEDFTSLPELVTPTCSTGFVSIHSYPFN